MLSKKIMWSFSFGLSFMIGQFCFADSLIGGASNSGICHHPSSYRVKVSCSFQSKAVEFDYVGSPFAYSTNRFRCEGNLDFYFPDLPEGQKSLKSNEGFMPDAFSAARVKVSGNQHDFDGHGELLRAFSSTDGMMYIDDISNYISFDPSVLISDNQKENLRLLLPEGTRRILCTRNRQRSTVAHCDLRGSDSFILSFPRLTITDGKKRNASRALLIKDTVQATLTQNSYVMDGSVAQEIAECSIRSAVVSAW